MSSGSHPYTNLPDRSFWSRAVSINNSLSDLFAPDAPVLHASDRIMSAGSCFAANIVPFLEAAGFAYVRTEAPSKFQNERFGYSKYSAAYGNIYTVRQLLQLVRRARGQFKPVEDRWIVDGAVLDPFRPGLPYPAESDEEFDVLTKTHLTQTLEAIAEADVFIFTLGLTEAWVSSIDGAVFPACPGTVAGTFDPAAHKFKNFTVEEVTQDLREVISELREIHPSLRVVLTVSPVPLVATATNGHVVLATAYSKSVLRVACETISKSTPKTIYFPAYEIVAGAQAPDYFEMDRRNVNPTGVEAVARALLAHSERPTVSKPQTQQKQPAAEVLSKMLANTECEEMMADPHLTRHNK